MSGGLPRPLRPLSRAEVRDVDRRAVEEFGMPSLVLMENAGRGAADVLLQRTVDGPVGVCAGKGNNGGDGFVIARHLENRGIDVRVLLFADAREIAGDAAINLGILQRAGTPIFECPAASAAAWESRLRSCAMLVDALLGTGMKGAVREPLAGVIDRINAAGVPVLAVDLPSGLDCDTGLPLGACVRAERTATFVARKLGFDAPGAVQFTGEVHVVDIGVPRSLLQRYAIAQ